MNDVVNFEVSKTSYIALVREELGVTLTFMYHDEDNKIFTEIGHVFLPKAQIKNIVEYLKQYE